MAQGEFNFSVDSQLISELGERLVTSNYIALSELIKNSYDADSPTVFVKFENISNLEAPEQERKISVRDTGVGMSLSHIRDFWMTIATPHKIDTPFSHEFGRPTTGNKGIGRFACQRLAKKLVIRSTAKVGSMFEHTEVSFNWDEFEPGQKVEKVPCLYKSKRSKSGKTGVTLELIGLRDRWTHRDFTMLQKYVALVSVAKSCKRRGFKEDPGFEATIECNEYEPQDFSVGKKTLESGWGTLKGSVDSKGILGLTLNQAPGNIKKSYQIENFNELAHTHFEIHIIPQSSHLPGVENRRNPKFLTQKMISNLWDTHSGIRLYLNKFRVYPYGDIEAGDDWLGIARDISKRRSTPDSTLKDVSESLGIKNFSRAMLNHPASRAHIGSVFIEGKALPAFEPKMDREGLIENAAFIALRRMLRLSLDWAALNYEAFLRSELNKQAEKRRTEFAKISGSENESARTQMNEAFKVLSKAAEVISKDEATSRKKDSSPTIKDSEGKQLAAASNFIESQFNELDAELDTLRSVAATAPLLFVFSHEFKGVITGLLSHAAKIEQIAGKIEEPSHKESLILLANEARNSSEQYEKITSLFDVFSDSQNFHKKKAILKKAIDQVSDGFSYLFTEFKIEFSVSNINPIMRAPHLNEAEIYSILINAISNSVKAVIATPKSRKINIEARSTSSGAELVISDTGVGIAKKEWENVFKPFISDPEAKIYSSLSSQLGDQQLSTLGRGSGLGLHIMRSIVAKHDGTVRFIEPLKGWKTSLQVLLPK